MLVAATLTPTEFVELTFDQAIDISLIDGNAFVVRDGVSGIEYVGNGGATLESPTTVRLILVGVGDWFEPGVTMTVTPDNGIVAADDAEPWDGVSDLELPFP